MTLAIDLIVDTTRVSRGKINEGDDIDHQLVKVLRESQMVRAIIEDKVKFR